MNAEGLAWGAAAGVIGTLAIATFYAALAAGAMSLVAPLSEARRRHDRNEDL